MQLFYSSQPIRMNPNFVANSELELLPNGELTSKLRRRVSGFVPMRGKKDNTILPLNYMEQAPRELDSDATLSRLSNGNAMDLIQQQQQLPTSLETTQTANGNWQPVVAVPRQFFYQMTNHRQEQDQAGSNGNNANWQAGSGSNGFGWGQQATNSMLMEAKLRRAFHPMRGKRTNSSPLSNLLISED